MPGPTNVNINSRVSLYDAFKTLTTERNHNQGTIEVVRESSAEWTRIGRDSDGAKAPVISLQCANHHFTRTSLNDPMGKTNTTPKELRETLGTAIKAELARAFGHVKTSNLTRFNNGDRETIQRNMARLQEACLAPLYGPGKQLRTDKFSRVDIGSIITNVEKIKQNLNIEQLLNADTITSEDMGTLRDVARYALGSGRGEGASGGRGFMGVTDDGTIVKFLTHHGETMDGFSEVGIAASDRLREKLAGIAGKLSPIQRGKVMDILNSGKGVEPLSRQDVARVITLIGGSAMDDKGDLFNWGDVKHAGTVKDTTLKAVFGEDALMEAESSVKGGGSLSSAQRKFLNEVAVRQKAYYKEKMAEAKSTVLTDGIVKSFLVECVKDQDFQEKAFKLFGEFCKPVPLADVKDAPACPCAKDPFATYGKDKTGNTTGKSINNLMNDDGEAPLVHIFADAKMHGGNIRGSGQEEGTFRDMSPITAAVLTKLGYLEYNSKSGKIEYALNEFGLPKLSSAEGFVVAGFKTCTDNVPNADGKPQVVKYLFSAAVSLGNKGNMDPYGYAVALNKTTQWLAQSPDAPAKLKVFNGVPAHDKVLNQNAVKFYTELVDHYGDDDLKEAPLFGIGSSDFQKTGEKRVMKATEMIMIANFAGRPDVFDPYDGDTKAQIDKLLKVMHDGDYKELLDTAVKNYEKYLDDQCAGLVKLINASGTKKFLSGDWGAGWFRNPAPRIAKGLAENWIKFGGNVKYLFNEYSRNSAGDSAGAKVWKEAFEAAQKKCVKLLGSVGYTDDQIVKHLKANDYQEDEIRTFFKDAGYSDDKIAEILAQRA